MKITAGMNFQELVQSMGRVSSIHTAKMLDELEQIVPPSNPLYKRLRKLVLDNMNDTKREQLSLIFGDDLEGYLK